MAVKEKMVGPAQVLALCGETIFELDGPGGGSKSVRKKAVRVWAGRRETNATSKQSTSRCRPARAGATERQSNLDALGVLAAARLGNQLGAAGSAIVTPARTRSRQSESQSQIGMPGGSMLGTPLPKAASELDFSVRELAARLGKPRTTVHKNVSGDRRLDPIEFVEWCEALEIDDPLAVMKASSKG